MVTLLLSEDSFITNLELKVGKLPPIFSQLTAWHRQGVQNGRYNLPDFYLPLLREEETRGEGKGITTHASTAVTTSGTAVLPDEPKLLVDEILAVTYPPLIPS